MSCIICACVTVIALDVSEGVGSVADAVEIGSLEHEAVVSWCGFNRFKYFSSFNRWPFLFFLFLV